MANTKFHAERESMINAPRTMEEMKTNLRQVQDIVGGMDSKIKALEEQASKLAEIDQKATEILGFISPLADPITKIASKSDQLINLSERIHRAVEMSALSGKNFGTARKIFELLNKLESWVLADDFNGKDEYKKNEIDPRMTELNNNTETKKILNELPSFDKLLESSFPQENNLQTRASYYMKILKYRNQIINFVASSSNQPGKR